MSSSYLDPLLRKYRKYSNQSVDPMGELIDRYRQFKNTRTLDLASVAAGLAIPAEGSEAMDPLALKALHDTNPNFDPDSISQYSDQELMGIVNSAKGKYFEYLVVKDLNAGNTVGDLTLPDGYEAKLAQSMTQPAWDVQIVDEHGHTAELIQLKATESVGYIHETLVRYPDIKILTTEEVAHHLGPNEMVLDSDMSEADLEHAVNSAAGTLDHGFLDDFWHNFHPLIPLLLIVTTQGYRVTMGKQTVGAAVEVAKARAARGLIASGAGAIAKTLSGSWIVSALSAVTAGMFFDRSQNIDELVEALRSRNRLLAVRSKHYKHLIAKTI
jgi:hypothetical protein